eukprot:scaffold2429_cov52-Phaeocystis_antarctica.AAC.1
MQAVPAVEIVEMNILKRTPPRLFTSRDARTCCPRYRFDRPLAAFSACLAALRPIAFHSAISLLCTEAAASAASALLCAAASLPLSWASISASLVRIRARAKVVSKVVSTVVGTVVSIAARLVRMKISSALGSLGCRSLSCRATSTPPSGPAATLSLART